MLAKQYSSHLKDKNYKAQFSMSYNITCQLTCQINGREQVSTLTIVSPIPRLKIPAKGTRGRSLYPEDIQMGSAHPNRSEKWLNVQDNIKKE